MDRVFLDPNFFAKNVGEPMVDGRVVSFYVSQPVFVFGFPLSRQMLFCS